MLRLAVYTYVFTLDCMYMDYTASSNRVKSSPIVIDIKFLSCICCSKVSCVLTIQ